MNHIHNFCPVTRWNCMAFPPRKERKYSLLLQIFYECKVTTNILVKMQGYQALNQGCWHQFDYYFACGKNILRLQVKGITNASWITLVSQHHLCSLVHVYVLKIIIIINLRWDTGTKPFLNRKVFVLLLSR